MSEVDPSARHRGAGAAAGRIQIITTFSAGLSVTSTQAAAVRAMLDFMVSPAATAAKLRNGMEPA